MLRLGSLVSAVGRGIRLFGEFVESLGVGLQVFTSDVEIPGAVVLGLILLGRWYPRGSIVILVLYVVFGEFRGFLLLFRSGGGLDAPTTD